MKQKLPRFHGNKHMSEPCVLLQTKTETFRLKTPPGRENPTSGDQVYKDCPRLRLGHDIKL
jgi:hypothetical protein